MDEKRYSKVGSEMITKKVQGDAYNETTGERIVNRKEEDKGLDAACGVILGIIVGFIFYAISYWIFIK